MNGFGNDFNDMSNKFQTSDGFEDSNFHQHEFNDRPPSRQKEPSLALGIGSEYGEDISKDDPGNQITSEIILTSGIPAPKNEFPSKYISSQARRGMGIDLRGASKCFDISSDDRPTTTKVGADSINLNEDHMPENGKRRKAFPMKDRKKNEKKSKFPL